MLLMYTVQLSALFAVADSQSYDAWTSEEGEPCQLPRSMHGEWHQYGHTQTITITSTHWLGRCVEMNFEQSKFIVERNGCFRCVYAMLEHANVVRYKQSNAQAIDCNLNAHSARVTKSKGIECHSETTTLSACNDNSTFRLAASECDYSLDFQCIGSWKKASRQYVALRLTTAPTETERYRCMLRERTSQGGRIGISADASCRELIDLNSASLFAQYEDVPLPRAKDHFANFLHTTDRWHWLSLRDHSQHHFTHTLWTKHSSDEDDSHANVLGYSNLGHLHKYLVYRVNGCQRGYQCVRIYKRTSQVIEIEYSPIYTREVLSVSLCPDDTQPSTIFDTLVASNFRVQKCPSDKQYTMRDCPEEAAYISFQCTAEHQLQLRHKCNTEARRTYECIDHWDEDGIVFVIVRDTSQQLPECLVMVYNDPHLSLHALGEKRACREARHHETTTINATELVDAICDTTTGGSRRHTSTTILLSILFFVLIKSFRR